MADNVELDLGSGGAKYAADDISGIHFTRVKIVLGADGTNDGDVASANALPVDVKAALPTGTNNIGDVDVLTVVTGTGATNLGKAVDSAAGGTDTGVATLAVRDDALSSLTPAAGDYAPLRVDANGALWVIPNGDTTIADGGNSITVDNGGTFAVQSTLQANSGVDIGDVDVLSVVPGTGATNLGKAIDTAAGSTDTGVAPLAVRDDALATLTPVDGDFVPLRTNNRGALWIKPDGDVSIDDGGNSITIDNAQLSVSGGGTEASALRVTIANDSTGVLSIDDNGGAITVDNGGTFATQATLQANSGVDVGDVDVLTCGTITPGTGATALGKAIDTAAGGTDTGVAALVIRDDTLTTLTPVDGDFVAMRVNSTGALHVTGGGGGTEFAVDDALGATPTGSLTLAKRDDALSALTPVEEDAVELRVDANGALWVIPSGDTTIADGGNSITVDNGGTFAVQVDAEFVDDAAFTLTSSKAMVAGAMRDDQHSLLAAAEGDIVPLRVDSNGNLHVHSHLFDPGTVDSFGHLVTSAYSNQIDIQFFRDTPANLTTVTTAGGGATSKVGGSGKWETSTAATANAKSETTQKTSYRSGSEIFALFTASFTAGVANSFQRVGLYDTNDGMFLGFEGTSFGVTIRNAASDTTVAKASFSEDQLTGAAGSEFTREGSPEAIDLTKINVYRIRYGWLGSAPIEFEVLSPDGHWVTFHHIHQPNNATIASIENPDLPMTLHVDKNSADGTNIIMISNCWGAGVTAGALPLDETLTDDVLAPVARTVLVGKTSGGAYVNVQTTTSGNLKMALDEYDGVPAGGGVESGTLRVTIANDSTGLLSIDDNGGSLTVDNGGTFAVQVDAALPAGTNAIGKLAANSGVDIGDVDVTSQPARAATTDNIGAQLSTSSIMDGTTAITPKFAVISASSSGDNEIVALVSATKIRVLAYYLVASAAVNVQWQDGGAANLTGVMNLAANSGVGAGFCPSGHFETAAGVNLALNLSGATATGGHIVYLEI